MVGSKPSAGTVPCPLCGRSAHTYPSGKLRWHGSPICPSGGLTLDQIRPGMTMVEAEEIKYGADRRRGVTPDQH